MDETLLLGGLAAVVALAVLLGGAAAVVAKFYRKVDQGKALIVNTMGIEPHVTFTGSIVYPIINRAEIMDISLKTIEISRSGKDGLICQDNIRADIKVAFFVRVSKTKEDVLKVAQSIGCERASEHETLEQLFAAKFSEALKTVGKKLDFEQLYTQRDDFKDRIIEVIGRDLNGYVLDDCAIDYLEQTPIENLDRDNILDARGIRKITEITAEQNLATNQLRQDERKETQRQNLEADEAILELERRRADAEAKQQREIATVRAKEEAEVKKVQAEELKRSEEARIRAEEEIQVAELSRQRQVQVADKDRERVVGIKSEQVQRDRDLEVISRKREVERQEIDKEMELEVKRKEIAEVVRTRIVVDKNVAEEEERIKDLRATAEAERHKDVQVIGAQAEAEEALVKSIKEAEAKERVAEHAAREQLTLAEAELQTADKVAQSKIRVAEGVQAEQAASGLAQVRVKEANAAAIEKEGLAEARVELERMQAEAKGSEEQGLAQARVRERAAEVAQREGLVEAEVLKAQAIAQAEGKAADADAVEKLGRAEAEAAKARLVAEAQGREAEAKVVETLGLAEAKAIEEKLRAEAAGLAEKIEAMRSMEGAAKEHEEFRLQLEHAEKVRLAAIEMQKQLAEAQAQVLAEAFGKADIQIVGGDGAFLDKFVQAASVGNAVEGFLETSKTAQAFLAPYLTPTSDDREAGSNGAGHAAAAPALTIERMMEKAETEEAREKLEDLLEKARELGL
ncbi:MAG: hypothetical protein KTR31_01410 [Myxococcales bacterium]|nr:hypothetical protein [Myxococcales bacterium]